VQADVIGALIMRELHTRFGRDNIGYLWMILEPMLLAFAVTILHAGAGGHTQFGIQPVPFWLTGYTPFVMFRSVVLRAESAIESNRTLLYHRMVTLPDMLIARALLEGASVTVALFILLAGASALDLANLPDRPVLLISGMALLLWFAFGLSMFVCAACESFGFANKLVHPITYIALPLSGAFFFLAWVPEPYRTYLSWFPMVQIYELIREGQFGNFESPYIDIGYIVGVCAVLTFLGLLSLRVIRAKLHVD
jgi:capsular polysaccharide transport system permease protein